MILVISSCCYLLAVLLCADHGLEWSVVETPKVEPLVVYICVQIYEKKLKKRFFG